MSLTLYRRRRALARPPARGRRRAPRAGAGGQGQRLRLRPRPAGPQGRSGSGVDTLAVGTYEELPEVASRFDGDLLVLTPWRPFGAASTSTRPSPTGWSTPSAGSTTSSELLERQPRRPARARAADQHAPARLHRPRAAGRRRAAPAARRRRLEGVALHLPLAQGSHLAEVHRLLTTSSPPGSTGTDRSGSATSPTTSSTQLRASYADFTFRPRIGTGLWLGDRERAAGDRDRARRARGRARRRRSATAAGPRPRPATCWSSAAAPPTASASSRRPARRRSRPGPPPSPAAAWTRSASCARRTPSTASSGCSPSRRTCRPRCCSCPRGARVPEVGDEVDVRVRYTATTFDRVVIELSRRTGRADRVVLGPQDVARPRSPTR